MLGHIYGRAHARPALIEAMTYLFGPFCYALSVVSIR